MTALDIQAPAIAHRDYCRDPADIVAERETDDVMPRRVQREASGVCMTCAHQRPALWSYPCDIGCMASPVTGGCRCWEPHPEVIA